MGKILVIKGADFSAVSVRKVNPASSKIDISVVASPTGGGIVTGSGSYDEGAIVTISASASKGYKFVKWNDNNTNASRTITVGSTSHTYTATFEAVPIVQIVWEQGNYDSGGNKATAAHLIRTQKMTIPEGATSITIKTDQTNSDSWTFGVLIWAGTSATRYISTNEESGIGSIHENPFTVQFGSNEGATHYAFFIGTSGSTPVDVANAETFIETWNVEVTGVDVEL